jgi:hypothetical protein
MYSGQFGQFELAVAVPRDGRSVRIREYGRQGLTFVEGRRGQPYSIIFRNNFASRVLAVISVDGLDVVDGKPATVISRGYIVEGYASAEIKGWRTSTSEVRQFFFEEKSSSYAARSAGDTTNCGIIACKVFAERTEHQTLVVNQTYIQPMSLGVIRWLPITSTYVVPQSSGAAFGTSTYVVPQSAGAAFGGTASNYACYAVDMPQSGGSSNFVNAPSPSVAVAEKDQNQPLEFNLGTGWGAPVTDCVALAGFDRAYEMASMAVYYTSAEALQRMGIVLDKEAAVSAPLPQGFGGFCQPPKGCA